MKFYIVLIFILSSISFSSSEEWKLIKKQGFYRTTDVIIKDIDNDKIDEIIISHFSPSGKFVDFYKIVNAELKLIDKIAVPYRTVFFDVGEIKNDGFSYIVFLAGDGLYHRRIGNGNKKFEFNPNIYSEIVVPQPELLKSVKMIIDLDGNGTNELVIENIRAIEIFETAKFTKIQAIDLKTNLEFSMVPGQYYPYYIFYTLPFILITDLDGDSKKEIITKFPNSINIYFQDDITSWHLKKSIPIPKDNGYFLSDSFLKFSFPVITDIDNDNKKEVVVSSAILDMPRIRFEAIGDVYALSNGSYNQNKNKRISVKGIPLNLPYFFNISDSKYKDFILPVIPFNLFSVFVLFSGDGSLNVPFIHFKQNQDSFDLKKGVKLFEIPFRVENVPSFIEELPFDYFKDKEFPDFYYFSHNFKQKTAEIICYNFDKNKKSYSQKIIQTLSIPTYTTQLPATLRLGYFSKNQKKDVLFTIHDSFYLLTRK